MRCLQAALDRVPLGRLHDARHDVEGQDALDAGAVAVDVEGDAEVDQGRVRRLLQAPELAVRQRLDGLDQQPGLGARLRAVLEQLVEPRTRVVAVEAHGRGSLSVRRGRSQSVAPQ